MATLNLQVIFDAKDKITGPMKAIIGGSNDLTKAFKKTNAELNNLKDQQNAINRYRELSTAINKTTADISRHKQIVSELKSQAKLGPLTQEQTKALSGSEAALKRLNKEYKNNTSLISEATSKVQQFGYNTDKLSSQESQLKQKISTTTTELNQRRKALDNAAKSQEKYANTQAVLQKGADIAKKGIVIAGAAAATMTIPVKLAIDYESAMADVKKVFAGTDSQFKSLNGEILQMSQRLPMAAKDIAAIVAAGAQSGVAVNELTRFAESAVKMGVAFDITASEAGQSMAEMRTAFRLSQTQVEELSDKINYLGNNTPAAAKGIMEIVQRIGPLGEIGGFASGSIAALGATLRGMGIQEEIAATGIKNMMLAMVAGESATKGQKGAWKELGLDYAKISKDMQKDANGTTLIVLKAISKLDKHKQASTAAELFGKESLSSIAPLITNIGSLEKNLAMVADKTKFAGSMNAEYAARAATTANNIQLFKNRISALGINIGTVLLPPLNMLLGKMGDIVMGVTTWAQKNPALASTITKVATGAVIALAAISALALGVVTLLGPLALFKTTLTVLAGGTGIAAAAIKMLLLPLKLVGIAFTVLGRSMLANPMVLAITAIVAVVAGAAYLIYKNWSPIKAFFSNLWSGIKNAFSTGVGYIKGVIQSVDNVFSNNPILNILMPFIGLPRIIIANWSTISAFFGQIWASISGVISVGITTATSIIGTGLNAVSSVFSTVWTAIKNTVSTAWTGICNLFLAVTPLGFIIKNFDQILAFLSSIGTRMLDIGRNIIDGLINGILSGFDRLKGIWTTINNYMPDFMRKKMDIHSPSRVMAGLGGHVVDGIGVGLNKNTGALQNQFNKTLGVFDTEPNGKFSNNPSSSNNAPKFQRATAIQNPKAISITNSDNITIHINGSGKGPLANAAEEVRQALAIRDRQRNADLRRMLTDSE